MSQNIHEEQITTENSHSDAGAADTSENFATKKIFATQPMCWAPEVQGVADWLLWAQGEKKIAETKDAPKLEFTDPLFRRRLSQISKMTVQVVHDVLCQTECGDIKQVFVSLRGEIAREFSINRSLICDGAILPAAFSLSVFNAPIALSSLAFNLKSGYSVIFPSQGKFGQAVKAACAPLLCGKEKQVLFVYADELVPEEYGDLRPTPNEPLAFASVFSVADQPEKMATGKIFSPHTNFALKDINEEMPVSDFLKKLILGWDRAM